MLTTNEDGEIPHQEKNGTMDLILFQWKAVFDKLAICIWTNNTAVAWWLRRYVTMLTSKLKSEVVTGYDG